MRLWSEERKSGTIALLFSFPTGSAALVIGKFLAAFIFGLIAMSGTMIIPVMLSVVGDPDLGPIVSGYTGAFLLLAFLLALGMAVSAFFDEQIVAFILTLVIGFGCYLAGNEFIVSFLDGWMPGLGTFLKETRGIPSHFNSFAKGVIDFGDSRYFVTLAALFLFINILTLEGHLRLSRSKAFIPGLVLLVAIAVFFNGIVRNLNLGRIDLTAEGLYSVSPATQKVLEKLTVPITVTYYVSSKEKLPSPMKDIARDVSDMLEELSRLSPKFTYRVVDPASLGENIKELQKKGITPFSAQTIEQDSLNVKRIYSALSVAYLDKKEEIIPQIIPETLGNLEYQIVSKIFRLTLEDEPKVVLVTPETHIDPQMAMIFQQMGRPVPEMDEYQNVKLLLESEGYRVVKQQLDKEHPLPEDARLLILMKPERLNERQQYEVARFLAQGKPVIIAVQEFKYSYNDAPSGFTVTAIKNSTNINELLSRYGLTVSDSMLFDRRHMILSITSQRGMGIFTALVQTPVNYPMQIHVLSDQMNQEVSITNNVSSLLYLWGTALKTEDETIEKLGLSKTVLFSSSPQSWEREYHPGPLGNNDFMPRKADELRARPLAMLLEGIFPNPFGADIPQWPGESSNSTTADEKTSSAQNQENNTSQPGPARLMVIGCAEMFSNTVLEALNNSDFLVNGVDALTLGDELIHVRGKARTMRFIRPVSTQAKLVWRGVVTFLIPTLWALFGILHAIKRKKNRQECKFEI